MISLNDANDLLEYLFDVVDQHIDDFIHVGRHRWDVVYFIFDRDPIYEVEYGPQEKGVELSFSEDRSSCIYDSDIRQPNDDVVTNLFYPFESDLSQYTQDESSLGNCDTNILYKDFQSPSCLNSDEYKVVARLEQSKIEKQCFHPGDFYEDLQMMKQRVLGFGKDFFFRPEPVCWCTIIRP
jgi:hypothetical protein